MDQIHTLTQLERQIGRIRERGKNINNIKRKDQLLMISTHGCIIRKLGQGRMKRYRDSRFIFMDVMFPPGVFFSSAGLWWCKKLAEMQRSFHIMVSLVLIQPKAFHTAFPLLICFS